jgi:DNA-binding NtrC family response regulator
MSERYCILCVDDDVSGLEARAALLEKEGYSVTAVSCPLRALEFDVSKFHLGCIGLRHARSERISALATFACSTRIFPDRVAQRYGPGRS